MADRKRARRGLIRGAILHLLAERPMHGYELINELEQRTGGRWKPSPGSVYPTLSALEDEGLITAVETDGKKRYELTEAGRTWLQERADERPGFGGPGGPGPTGRRGPGAASAGSATSARWASCAASAARCSASCAKSGASGTEAQQAQAKEILARTRDELYAVMAQPRGDDEDADDAGSTEPTTEA